MDEAYPDLHRRLFSRGIDFSFGKGSEEDLFGRCWGGGEGRIKCSRGGVATAIEGYDDDGDDDDENAAGDGDDDENAAGAALYKRP